jgi:hypothetical protein
MSYIKAIHSLKDLIWILDFMVPWKMFPMV